MEIWFRCSPGKLITFWGRQCLAAPIFCLIGSLDILSQKLYTHWSTKVCQNVHVLFIFSDVFFSIFYRLLQLVSQKSDQMEIALELERIIGFLDSKKLGRAF